MPFFIYFFFKAIVSFSVTGKLKVVNVGNFRNEKIVIYQRQILHAEKNKLCAD